LQFHHLLLESQIPLSAAITGASQLGCDAAGIACAVVLHFVAFFIHDYQNPFSLVAGNIPNFYSPDF
jgi:hypothetical protein